MTDSQIHEGWLIPAAPQRLEAEDRFTGTDANVGDFWRWAFSDLRDNTTRGILAEFLVALALGRTGDRRIVWDNYDVRTDSGIRVEVKASGNLQSWPQLRLSRLSFGRMSGRAFDANTNTFDTEASIRADVFVFAVQTCCEPSSYDTRDISQWEFYVVPAHEVAESKFKSVSISWVKSRTGVKAIKFEQLGAAIETAGAKARRAVSDSADYLDRDVPIYLRDEEPPDEAA
jgi:hypothetical protein